MSFNSQYLGKYTELIMGNCSSQTVSPHWTTSGPGVVINLVFLAVHREDYILKHEGSVSSSEFSIPGHSHQRLRENNLSNEDVARQL